MLLAVIIAVVVILFLYRPVKVEAPEGCLLNPKFPAAVVSRAQTGHYVPILILGALHHRLSRA